jgi:exonuclease VII large subunit
MWYSDASLEYDDSSDDDKKSKKKALASIAINNKSSIFDTSSTCLMAKSPKVKYDDSDDDACESDYCRSDDDDDNEDFKEDLMDMLKNAHTCLEMKRKKCKELRKELKALKRSFDELNASHESLRKDHEELDNTHTKLERAHSSLLEQVKKEEAKKGQVIVSCDVRLTCDILDESFYKPIIVAPTNLSCSTTTSTSPLRDGFICDASLMVKNDTLKKKVNDLTCVLGNAYGGDARLLKCLGSQRFSRNKEGLGYTPKKGKAVFVTPKASFLMGNGQFCNRYK